MLDDGSEFTSFGELTWLLMHSKLHQSVPLHKIKYLIMPPIHLRQFKILYDATMPVAFVTWANFSEKDEVDYIKNPISPNVNAWNSGDRLWIIDFISPFSRLNTVKLVSFLRQKFPDKYARAIRVRPGNSTGIIHTYPGANPIDNWRMTADIEILNTWLGKERSQI